MKAERVEKIRKCEHPSTNTHRIFAWELSRRIRAIRTL